jgi:hypothetical protein
MHAWHEFPNFGVIDRCCTTATWKTQESCSQFGRFVPFWKDKMDVTRAAAPRRPLVCNGQTINTASTSDGCSHVRPLADGVLLASAGQGTGRSFSTAMPLPASARVWTRQSCRNDKIWCEFVCRIRCAVTLVDPLQAAAATPRVENTERHSTNYFRYV